MGCWRVTGSDSGRADASLSNASCCIQATWSVCGVKDTPLSASELREGGTSLTIASGVYLGNLLLCFPDEKWE